MLGVVHYLLASVRTSIIMSSKTWRVFAAGLVCGLIVGFSVFHFFGERYRVEAGGPSRMMMIRLDSWTGKSWMGRYYEKNGSTVWYWEPMEVRTP